MDGDHGSRQGLTIEQLREVADAALADTAADTADGPSLTPLEEALISFGLAAATTSLDTDGMADHGRTVVAAGGSIDHLVGVLLLVAPLGMHTLHEGVREVRSIVEAVDPDLLTRDLDPERSALRERFEGDSSYWQRLDRELPGFLDGLLRLSPDAYRGFFEFCALAWRTDSIEPRTKELVYLAIDATPTHRYGPGFRLHLDNARRLGATQRQIDATLDLAAGAPSHRGVAR